MIKKTLKLTLQNIKNLFYKQAHIIYIYLINGCTTIKSYHFLSKKHLIPYNQSTQ